jgi:adenine deaminase
MENLVDWKLLKTVINGETVYDGMVHIASVNETPINQFQARNVLASEFAVPAHEAQTSIRVIEALEGQLITRTHLATPRIANGQIVSDPSNDILKIAVVNRYQLAPPAIGFIKNIQLKEGAFASTVAHDSHNIVVVGVNDNEMAHAVNVLMQAEGGVCAVNQEHVSCLPLPVGGLMSTRSAEWIANTYSAVDQQVKAQGTLLKAPFMTLSFMALLVIPQLKLSDLGLFDGENFKFVSLYA